MADVRNHPVAYRLADHELAPAAFAWAFYDEYLPRAHAGEVLIAREEIQTSNFARTFLLSPTQVEAALETARKHQLVASHGTQLRLLFGDASTLTEALISKAM